MKGVHIVGNIKISCVRCLDKAPIIVKRRTAPSKKIALELFSNSGPFDHCVHNNLKVSMPQPLIFIPNHKPIHPSTALVIGYIKAFSSGKFLHDKQVVSRPSSINLKLLDFLAF